MQLRHAQQEIRFAFKVLLAGNLRVERVGVLKVLEVVERYLGQLAKDAGDVNIADAYDLMVGMVRCVDQSLTRYVREQVTDAERVRRVYRRLILDLGHCPFIFPMNGVVETKPAVETIVCIEVNVMFDVAEQQEDVQQDVIVGAVDDSCRRTVVACPEQRGELLVSHEWIVLWDT